MRVVSGASFCQALRKNDWTHLRTWDSHQTISQFLGHSGRSALETTAQYLHAGEEQLREVSEMAALKPTATQEPDRSQRVSKCHIRHILRR